MTVADTMTFGLSAFAIILAIFSLWLNRLPRKVRVNLPPPKMEETAHHRYAVTIAIPQGSAQFWQISDPAKKGEKPYAWAFVVADVAAAECFLWMVYVRENVRRRGYGRDMIRVLQEKFKKITTHYDRVIVSKPGTKLCMACGFAMKPAMFKRDVGELVWERKG